MIRRLVIFLRKQGLGSKRGQTFTEYAIVAGMLIAAVAILVVFLATFREYGGRILDLAASEYP
jgi:hypothetical protein